MTTRFSQATMDALKARLTAAEKVAEAWKLSFPGPKYQHVIAQKQAVVDWIKALLAPTPGIDV